MGNYLIPFNNFDAYNNYTIFTHQMFPMAITTGNTFVMKPSEVDPGCPMRLCELAIEAGVPAGVLNVIHGTHVSYITHTISTPLYGMIY